MRALIEAANRKRSPEALREYMKRSAYADTLNKVTAPKSGAPAGGYTFTEHDSDRPNAPVYGEYIPGSDQVTLRESLMASLGAIADKKTVAEGFSHAANKDPGGPTARGVLAHEYGHRYMEQNYLAANRARLLGQSTDPFKAYPPSPAPPGKLDIGSGERLADAFSNAIQYLAATAQKDPISDAYQPKINLLGKYEAQVPGTGEMVRQIIQRPIYANHPLRGAFTTPKDYGTP